MYHWGTHQFTQNPVISSRMTQYGDGQLLHEHTKQLTKVKRFLAICLSIPGNVGLSTSVTLLGQRLYAMSASRLLRNCTHMPRRSMTAGDVLMKLMSHNVTCDMLRDSQLRLGAACQSDTYFDQFGLEQATASEYRHSVHNKVVDIHMTFSNFTNTRSGIMGTTETQRPTLILRSDKCSRAFDSLFSISRTLHAMGITWLSRDHKA